MKINRVKEMVDGLYYPSACRVIGKKIETHDTFLLKLTFIDSIEADRFNYRPGQFVIAGVGGVGECPISITSSPSVQHWLEVCIRAVGRVTGALCALEEGDIVGIRGPFGRPFPLEEIRSAEIIFVAGGIGIVPLRSVINQVFSARADFGRVEIVYGARTPSELCFMDEIEVWRRIDGVRVNLTVDRKFEGWDGHVGFVPQYFDELGYRSDEGVVFVCGPPVMIKIMLEKLRVRGWSPDRVWTTLEKKMRCGVGKCGRCLIGTRYVCTDGPVFSMRELETIGWI